MASAPPAAGCRIGAAAYGTGTVTGEALLAADTSAHRPHPLREVRERPTLGPFGPCGGRPGPAAAFMFGLPGQSQGARPVRASRRAIPVEAHRRAGGYAALG